MHNTQHSTTVNSIHIRLCPDQFAFSGRCDSNVCSQSTHAFCRHVAARNGNASDTDRGQHRHSHQRACDKADPHPTHHPAIPARQVAGRSTMHRCDASGLMVEVHHVKLVLRITYTEVDCKSVWARRVANGPDAAQHPTLERAQRSILVPLVGVRHEGQPAFVAKASAHAPCNARGGCAHKSTPALLCTTHCEFSQ